MMVSYTLCSLLQNLSAQLYSVVYDPILGHLTKTEFGVSFHGAKLKFECVCIDWLSMISIKSESLTPLLHRLMAICLATADSNSSEYIGSSLFSPRIESVQ